MSEDKAPAVVEVSKEEIEKHKTMAILAWIIFFIPLPYLIFLTLLLVLRLT